MANLQKLIDLNGLNYFLKQIKAKFVRSINGAKPDSKGNINIANMEGATSNAAGKAGLVPIPATGKQDMALCGDATFKVLPIAGGGTGADNVTSALSNLGILGAIVNASVSGKTITFTKKDNTKFSIDTQDTNNGIVAALLEQNGYAKFKNGLILQWGKHARTADYEQITFPISFTNVNYTCISTSYDLNSNADVTAAYSGTYNSGKYPEEQERTVSRFYVKTGSNAGGRDWIAIGQ